MILNLQTANKQSDKVTDSMLNATVGHGDHKKKNKKMAEIDQPDLN